MNQGFKAAVANFVREPKALSHKQVVTRLYRKSLKVLSSWTIDRDLTYSESLKLREDFESNRNVSEPYVLFRFTRCVTPISGFLTIP